MAITNMIEAIEYWGKESPNALCFKDREKAYTYHDLWEKSERLAQALGAKYESRKPIVVYGNLDFEMLVAFLACTKAGHAYIPIDDHTPDERVALILEVAQPEAVLAVSPWPDMLIPDDIEILAKTQLNTYMNEDHSENKQHLQPVEQDENYYIIFTSGTTGVPKGVQISHRNLCSFVSWIQQDFGIATGQRFLSQAPYSFDLSVMDVYPALATGGSLAPLGKDLVNDFKSLFTHLPAMGLNVWVSTPSFADICLMDESFCQDQLGSLQHFLFCGEELTHQTAAKLHERFPHAKVYNTYGPTEATVAITEVLIDDEVLSTYSRLPIGKVKPDTRVVILDENGSEVAKGVQGEIVIAGPSVSCGYMNNPEKTKEAFFEYEGQQAYRTGDAGLFDGELLFYKGRMDFQVKLNGFRIELEDIDHHLSEVSYVQQAAVVPKYKDHKVQQLVAFVVPNKHSFDKEFRLTSAIKKELLESVMDYMVPHKFVYLEQLPMTQNGKVDRKSLIQQVNAS